MNGRTHIVKRAIVVAAGIGKRMQPLTLKTPKPLVSVNGVRMIDSVIAALWENGIREIYVVVGYFKEQFAFLPEQWPGLKIIENPLYETWNNISSLYAAREHLEDCIILDGDQMIVEPDALSPCFTRSGYNAVWCDGDTDEWLLDVREGIVRGCSRTGGAKGWQLYSVSRWTAEDGRCLRNCLEREYELGSRDLYWDDVPLFRYPELFTLGIREMNQGDVIEIDTLEELAAIDRSYQPWLKSADGGTIL